MERNKIIKLRQDLYALITKTEEQLAELKQRLNGLQELCSDEELYAENVFNLCRMWGIDETELREKNRAAGIVMRKHILRWFGYHKLNLGYTQLAKLMGVHHATIIHSVNYVNDEMSHKPEARHHVFTEEYSKVKAYIDDFE